MAYFQGQNVTLPRSNASHPKTIWPVFYQSWNIILRTISAYTRVKVDGTVTMSLVYISFSFYKYNRITSLRRGCSLSKRRSAMRPFSFNHALKLNREIATKRSDGVSVFR